MCQEIQPGCTPVDTLGEQSSTALQRYGSMVLTLALNPGIISTYALLMAPHISPSHSHLSSQPGRWRGRARIWMKNEEKNLNSKECSKECILMQLESTSYLTISYYCTPRKVKQAAKCSAFSERNWELNLIGK